MEIDKKLFEEVIFEIKKEESLKDIFKNIKEKILLLFKADSFTFYKKNDKVEKITSIYISLKDFRKPIILPIDFSSIAGYVAYSKKYVSIEDVYDKKKLKKIDPKLSFNYSYDQQVGYLSESMLVFPIITSKGVEGIFQIINYVDGGVFPNEILEMSLEIIQILATKFKRTMKDDLGIFQDLVENNQITFEKLNEAEKDAKEKNMTVACILIENYDIDKKIIADCLSNYYQVPFANISMFESASKSLMEGLNRNLLANRRWVPIRRDLNEYVVVLGDPSNRELIKEICEVLQVRSVKIYVSLVENILSHIGLKKDDRGSQKDEKVEMIIEEIDIDQEEDADVEKTSDLMDAEATSVIRLVNKIITDAVKMNASDIHIEPMADKPARVRMRVDGVCRKVVEIPESIVRSVVSRIKILSHLDIAEKRKPQDGKMGVKMGGVPLELRIASLPVVAGESVVMRILQQGLPLSFSKLRLSPRNEKAINEFLKYSHGLILVVGPTGSGKTTTLHAILFLINNEERKILTAEDPVEIVQDGLQQVQVMVKAGITFASILRAFLRCDPDVILIGEMRDEETASIGIEASLTGHLVFSTLHTNSAPETITRLLDMGIEPLNFSDALVGILSQRLARLLCSVCKKSYSPDKEEVDRLINLYGREYFKKDFPNHDSEKITLCKAEGCEKCDNSGYRGRVGVHEVLSATPAIKKLVANKGVIGEIRDQAMSDGMRSLSQDAIWKIFEGLLDLDMARKVGVH